MVTSWPWQIAAVTTPWRRNADARARAIHADGLADDALVICSVGRQVRRKGHAWFAGSVMPGLPGDVHLWLVGEGPEAAAIDAAAARAGAAARVRRLGAISDQRLKALYRGADLFVMPNIPVPDDIEGFGLVLLEANLNGLPVVAADLEGVGEVVRDGVNGRLAPPGDADAFATAILKLRDDPRERQRLALKAETHVRHGYSWDSVAERQRGLLMAARRQAATRVGSADGGGRVLSAAAH